MDRTAAYGTTYEYLLEAVDFSGAKAQYGPRTGCLVRTLNRPGKPMAAGRNRLLWDARDDKGFEVPSGQYFYRFTAPKYVKTRKMLLVK